MNENTSHDLENQTLSPYDLFSLCSFIQKHPKDVLDDYCHKQVDCVTSLPVIILDVDHILSTDPYYSKIICWLIKRAYTDNAASNEIQQTVSGTLDSLYKLTNSCTIEKLINLQYLTQVLLYENYDLRKPFLKQFNQNNAVLTDFLLSQK